MRRLTKIITLLLLAALLLFTFVTVTKALPFFYAVDEKTVTIAAGDTLWSIASKHIGEYPGGIHGYLAEICRRNGIENIDCIASGSELILPIYRYRLG